MNSKQVETGLLINEWQLGTQLNIAVASGTRDKFNLLLSFLSEDVRDFAQFELPKALQSELSRVELRESLSLPAAQPLVNTGISLQQSEKLSALLHKNQITDLRLQCLLNNEALLSRQPPPDIDAEVVDNLPFLSQTRLKQGSNSERERQTSPTGIDHQLMENYQMLNIDNNPLKVSYL